MPLDTDQPCHQMHAKLESCDAQQRHWPRCARTKIAAEIAAAARIVLGPSKPAVTTIRHGFSPLRCFPTFSRVHMGVMYRCQRLPCPLAPASYTRGSYHGILPVIIENIIIIISRVASGRTCTGTGTRTRVASGRIQLYPRRFWTAHRELTEQAEHREEIQPSVVWRRTQRQQ